MKTKIVIAAILLSIGMFGCDSKPEIIGLWEFDLSATNLESPKPNKGLLHRARFKKDQSVLQESINGRYSISAWQWNEFHGDRRELPPYLHPVHEKGLQIYLNQVLLVFQGGKYEWGFQHKYTFYTSYGYFNGKNQLVLFDPNDETVFVYNRIN